MNKIKVSIQSIKNLFLNVEWCDDDWEKKYRQLKCLFRFPPFFTVEGLHHIVCVSDAIGSEVFYGQK